VIELRSGRGAELQAVRQRQQAMRVLVCEQVRILLRWRGKHRDGRALTRQPLAHQSEALLKTE